MIDDDREETPPFGLDQKMLWGMGFGPVKRDEILDVLHDIQRQQIAIGSPVLGVRDLCNLMIPRFRDWSPLGTVNQEMTPSQGEQWRHRRD